MDGNIEELSNCGMNLNVNTKSAACDLSRLDVTKRMRAALRCNLFQPQLESGLQKNSGLPARVVKAQAARALTIKDR